MLVDFVVGVMDIIYGKNVIYEFLLLVRLYIYIYIYIYGKIVMSEIFFLVEIIKILVTNSLMDDELILYKSYLVTHCTLC